MNRNIVLILIYTVLNKSTTNVWSLTVLSVFLFDITQSNFYHLTNPLTYLTVCVKSSTNNKDLEGLTCVLVTCSSHCALENRNSSQFMQENLSYTVKVIPFVSVHIFSGNGFFVVFKKYTSAKLCHKVSRDDPLKLNVKYTHAIQIPFQKNYTWNLEVRYGHFRKRRQVGLVLALDLKIALSSLISMNGLSVKRLHWSDVLCILSREVTSQKSKKRGSV